MLDLERTLSSILVAMDQELTIQQVAAMTQLSVYTLRYYERIELLTPINRNHRGFKPPRLGGLFLGRGLNPLPKNFAVNCQLSTVNC